MTSRHWHPPVIPECAVRNARAVQADRGEEERPCSSGTSSHDWEDDAVADEALIALGDLALTARVAAAASREAMTRGEFVAACVGQFATRSSDEQ